MDDVGDSTSRSGLLLLTGSRGFTSFIRSTIAPHRQDASCGSFTCAVIIIIIIGSLLFSLSVSSCCCSLLLPVVVVTACVCRQQV